MARTLLDALSGERVRVIKISAQDDIIKRRLMDMGITRGTAISVERVAPLGDPIEIAVRGYHLALRKREAGVILIESTTESRR